MISASAALIDRKCIADTHRSGESLIAAGPKRTCIAFLHICEPCARKAVEAADAEQERRASGEATEPRSARPCEGPASALVDFSLARPASLYRSLRD
jgi:hypothetical protein